MTGRDRESYNKFLIYFNTYKYKTDILLKKNNIQFIN